MSPHRDFRISAALSACLAAAALFVAGAGAPRIQFLDALPPSQAAARVE